MSSFIPIFTNVQLNVGCMLFIYAMNWSKAASFDIAGSNETGQLLFANSWSPSFGSGTTCNIFQEVGNNEDNKEWFTMSVSAGKIHGKASLITDIGTLSWTGTLLDWKNITILWISPSETAWKWNFSNSSVCWLMSTGEAIDGRSCNTARDANTSAALASTEVNSSTMTFISLEYSSCVESYPGMQFLITFHLELFFWQESSSYWTCFLSASRRRILLDHCALHDSFANPEANWSLEQS